MARAITTLLATGAVLAAASGAQAEDWFAFYMKPQGVTYVDKDSIIRRPGSVSARIQSTFPQPEHLQKDGRIITYTKSVDMIDVDCKARVYRFLERRLTDNTGLVQTTISDPDDVMLIQDGAPEDVLAKAFCPKS